MHTLSNIDEYQPRQPVDTLVHLGVGRCSALEAYLAMQPKRMLLVEADPQLAEAVQTRTASLPQVQVHCAAVAGSPGPATFFRYNLPDAGSLHPASGLLQLFPGLKTVEEIQVDAVSPAALLQPLQLQQAQENLLIIDLPGEELPVLQALQQAGQLYLFSQLQLHCGHQPLYEGGKSAARILQWLQGQGFDVLNEDDTRDPAKPCWTLQRNVLYLRNQELEQQLQLANQTRVKQEKLAAEASAEIEQITQAFDEQSKLVAEQQGQIQQLTQARNEQMQVAQQRENQLGNITHAHDEHERVSKERLANIELLTQELDQQTQQLTQVRDEQLQLANQTKVEQEKLAVEANARIEQLTQAFDEQSLLAAERQVQIQQLTQARDEQLQLANQTKVEQEKLAAEANAKIEQLTQAYDGQSKLVAEQQGQIQQLTQTRNEQMQVAQQRENQLGNITHARDEHERVSKERLANIELLTQELEQQTQLLAEQQDQNRYLQECIEKLNVSVAGLTEELRQARQTANLATKFQTLREADLEDLQIRYKEAVTVQERQHQLMLQLEEKLRLAAQYFHQLNNSAVRSMALTSENIPLAKPERRHKDKKKKKGKKGKV